MIYTFNLSCVDGIIKIIYLEARKNEKQRGNIKSIIGGIAMEFAKYYNGTSIVEKLVKNENIISDWNTYKGIYMCNDTNDFWVCRIIEGYNEEYEKEENSWLIERNKIDKYDLVEFINEILKKNITIKNKIDMNNFFDKINDKQLMEYIILYDDKQGLENWDCKQADSLENCIDMIDDGYGIVEI